MLRRRILILGATAAGDECQQDENSANAAHVQADAMREFDTHHQQTVITDAAVSDQSRERASCARCSSMLKCAVMNGIRRVLLAQPLLRPQPPGAGVVGGRQRVHVLREPARALSLRQHRSMTEAHEVVPGARDGHVEQIRPRIEKSQ